MKQAGSSEVSDRPLDPVMLGERIRAEGQLTGQLIERQNLGVDEQDFSQHGRLVAIVLVGGGRDALINGATRLVVQCQPSASSGGGVRAERLVPRMAVG